MPRRSNHPPDCQFFHVLNRAIQGLVLFEAPSEYRSFLSLLAEAVQRFPASVFAYTVMPNHWHVVLQCSSGGSLSQLMHWLGTTHAQRWRGARGLRGRGAVYQGRFKSIGVATDRHFLTVCRYVERNPLRAKLVAWAEEWPWSSVTARTTADDAPALAVWPTPRPEPWLEVLNQPEPPAELREVRRCVRRSLPFGFSAEPDDSRRTPRFG